MRNKENKRNINTSWQSENVIELEPLLKNAVEMAINQLGAKCVFIILSCCTVFV